MPNCPVTCSLRQDGSDGYSDASIASFSSSTGVFSISEFNFERDTFQMDLSLECVSDLSESFIGSSSNTFTLQLLDVCRTADLSIADLSPSTMPTMLWPVPVDYFSFSGLESSLPCGPYTYYIRSDPAIADGLSISGFSNLAIQAQMTDISQVSNDWELYIDACVQFGDGTESCVSTNTVTMQVRDPCIITDVNSSSIDRMLQASYSTPDI